MASTTFADAAPFAVGDAVRVEAPTACPVADAAVIAGHWSHRVNITGYSGVVTALCRGGDGRWRVTLAWDSRTLLRVSSAWQRFWAAQADGDRHFGEVTLDSRRLQAIAPVDDAGARRQAHLGMRIDLRRMHALQALGDAAHLPASRRDAGRVQATVLRYPPAVAGQEWRIVECDSLEDLLQLSAHSELRFFTGSLRRDHAGVGVPRTRRALDRLRPRCAETARVILEWFEAGALTEAEVVVAIQPRVPAQGIPAFTLPA